MGVECLLLSGGLSSVHRSLSQGNADRPEERPRSDIVQHGDGLCRDGAIHGCDQMLRTKRPSGLDQGRGPVGSGADSPVQAARACEATPVLSVPSTCSYPTPETLHHGLRDMHRPDRRCGPDHPSPSSVIEASVSLSDKGQAMLLEAFEMRSLTRPPCWGRIRRVLWIHVRPADRHWSQASRTRSRWHRGSVPNAVGHLLDSIEIDSVVSWVADSRSTILTPIAPVVVVNRSPDVANVRLCGDMVDDFVTAEQVDDAYSVLVMMGDGSSVPRWLGHQPVAGSRHRNHTDDSIHDEHWCCHRCMLHHPLADDDRPHRTGSSKGCPSQHLTSHRLGRH